MKSKRGQITIFIIIALVVVAVISAVILYKRGLLPDIGGTKDINPDSFMESCLQKKIKEGINILYDQGGNINPTLYRKFQFTNETKPSNISYLCYTQNYYVPCINQAPMLIQHIKSEIEDYISYDTRSCFDELTSKLEKQKYVVDAKYNGFEIELDPNKVITNIDAELILTKNDETTDKKGFKVFASSKIYDLSVLVQEIISQEARFCNFEDLGFMILYPEFEIDKFRTGDSTIIYTVGDRETGEKIKFAVRSCIIPPGI